MCSVHLKGAGTLASSGSALSAQRGMATHLCSHSKQHLLTCEFSRSIQPATAKAFDLWVEGNTGQRDMAI